MLHDLNNDKNDALRIRSTQGHEKIAKSLGQKVYYIRWRTATSAGIDFCDCSDLENGKSQDREKNVSVAGFISKAQYH